MITEDYVSFEVAKLLKDKGFNESLRTIYRNGDIINIVASMCNSELKIFAKEQNLSCVEVSAPTQAITMKWLREVHNIDIIAPPQYNNVEWTYSAIIVKLSIPCTEIRLNDNKYKKEEAVETAIKYCLENLI